MLTQLRLDEIKGLISKIQVDSFENRALIPYALAITELVNETDNLKRLVEAVEDESDVQVAEARYETEALRARVTQLENVIKDELILAEDAMKSPRDGSESHDDFRTTRLFLIKKLAKEAGIEVSANDKNPSRMMPVSYAQSILRRCEERAEKAEAELARVMTVVEALRKWYFAPFESDTSVARLKIAMDCISDFLREVSGDD